MSFSLHFIVLRKWLCIQSGLFSLDSCKFCKFISIAGHTKVTTYQPMDKVSFDFTVYLNRLIIDLAKTHFPLITFRCDNKILNLKSYALKTVFHTISLKSYATEKLFWNLFVIDICLTSKHISFQVFQQL